MGERFQRGDRLAGFQPPSLADLPNPNFHTAFPIQLLSEQANVPGWRRYGRPGKLHGAVNCGKPPLDALLGHRDRSLLDARREGNSTRYRWGSPSMPNARFESHLGVHDDGSESPLRSESGRIRQQLESPDSGRTSRHRQPRTTSAIHLGADIRPPKCTDTRNAGPRVRTGVVCGAPLLSSSPTARYRASDWYRITHISGWIGRVSGARETVNVSNRLTFFSPFRKPLSSSMGQAAVTAVL